MKRRLITITILVLATLIVQLGLTGCQKTSPDEDIKPDAQETEEPSDGEGAEEPETQEPQESDEDIIRKDVESKIGTVKMDKEALAQAMREDEASMETYELANIDVDEYAEALSAHMGTSITSVQVEGNKGEVIVEMTMPDFDKMDKTLETLLNEYVASHDTTNMSTEDYYAAIGDLIMQVSKDPELPEKKETFNVSYTKVGDQWSMDDQSKILGEMENAFLGD